MASPMTIMPPGLQAGGSNPQVVMPVMPNSNFSLKVPGTVPPVMGGAPSIDLSSLFAGAEAAAKAPSGPPPFSKAGAPEPPEAQSGSGDAEVLANGDAGALTGGDQSQPSSKKRRTSMWDQGQEGGPPPPPPPAVDDKPAPVAVVPPSGLNEEDAKWRDQWGEVFMELQKVEMQNRAGEYAEAVVALWQQTQALRRQLSLVQTACDQLFLTASREALENHIAGLLITHSESVPADIQEAARREAEDLEKAVMSVALPQMGGHLGAVGTSLLNAASAGTGGQQAMVKARPPTPGGLPQAVPPRVGVGTPLPQMNTLSMQDASHNNLYVSGMPPGIDDEMFHQLFSRYGPILSTKVVPERNYGFVKFSLSKDAQAAIDALNNFEFNGTRLAVRFAARDGATQKISVGVSGHMNMLGQPLMHPASGPPSHIL